MLQKILVLSLITIATVYSAPALSLDLVNTWELALENDPDYQAARYTTEAEHENIPQARAQLMPNVSLSGAQSHNNTDLSYINAPYPSNSAGYTAKGYALSVRQPLLRMQSYYKLKESEAQAYAADGTLDKEFQTMVVRVAGAYFDTLLAFERSENARTQTDFYRKQLTQAEKSFQHGTGTRTDIEDAKSRLDSALAKEIESRNGITVTEKALEAIIGRKVKAGELHPLDPEKLPLALPTPDTLEEWIKLAETNSPEIASLRHSLEAANLEIDRAQAAHYPTVDLVASKSYSSSDSNSTIGQIYNTTSIGVQVNVPIFAGGGVVASVRQAIANRESARYQMESTTRKLEVELSKEFSAVEQGIARIRALEQAVKSSQQAVIGNEKGEMAGTRNIVDVQNAQQQLFSARTDLLDARHNFVMALLRLKALSGVIKSADVKQVNSWLSGS
jgi:outer membrane protein, protease secretion system